MYFGPKITFTGLEKSIVWGEPEAMLKYCKQVNDELRRTSLQYEDVRNNEFNKLVNGIGAINYRTVDTLETFLKEAERLRMPDDAHGYRQLYDFHNAFQRDLRDMGGTFKGVVSSGNKFVPATTRTERKTYRGGYLVDVSYSDDSHFRSILPADKLSGDTVGVVSRIVNHSQPIMESAVKFWSSTIHDLNNFIPRYEKARKKKSQEEEANRTDAEWDALIEKTQDEETERASNVHKFLERIERDRKHILKEAMPYTSLLMWARDDFLKNGLLNKSQQEVIDFNRKWTKGAQEVASDLREKWLEIASLENMPKIMKRFNPDAKSIYEPAVIKHKLERFKKFNTLTESYFTDYLCDLIKQANDEKKSIGLGALMRKVYKKSRDKSKIRELEEQEEILGEIASGALIQSCQNLAQVLKDIQCAYEELFMHTFREGSERVKQLEDRRMRVQSQK